MSFGAARGLRVEPGSQLAEVGAAVLSAQRVTLSMDQTWPVPALPPNVIRTPGPELGVPAIVITDRVMGAEPPRVIYRPPSLVLGAGASRGVDAAEMGDLMDKALADAGLSAASVCRVATVDLKEDERGLVGGGAGARLGGGRLRCLRTWRRSTVPNPSETCARRSARRASPRRPRLSRPVRAPCLSRTRARARVPPWRSRGGVRAAGSRLSGSARARAT